MGYRFWVMGFSFTTFNPFRRGLPYQVCFLRIVRFDSLGRDDHRRIATRRVLRLVRHYACYVATGQDTCE